MHVYNYIRVSSKGQVDGDGPERQREAIVAFNATHGLQALGEFFEAGVSGTVDGLDRPEFSDMLERIPHMNRNGVHIEAVVVERVDRLARDLMVSELLLKECRTRGIKVFSADQGALIDMASDGGDPTRVLIRQIMGALAQWERTCLVRKLKIARDRKKVETGRCEGGKPYGALPNEPSLILYIRSLCEQPEPPSYEQMAQSLNMAGLLNRRGTRWTKSCIHSLVQRVAKREGWSLAPRNPYGHFLPRS